MQDDKGRDIEESYRVIARATVQSRNVEVMQITGESFIVYDAATDIPLLGYAYRMNADLLRDWINALSPEAYREWLIERGYVQANGRGYA